MRRRGLLRAHLGTAGVDVPSLPVSLEEASPKVSVQATYARTSRSDAAETTPGTGKRQAPTHGHHET